MMQKFHDGLMEGLRGLVASYVFMNYSYLM